MLHSEQEAIERLTTLFEECRLLHRKAYPSSSIDFDRLNFTGQLSHGRLPHAKGHYSDVYKGETLDGTVVAVKVLRLPVYDPNEDKIYKDTVLRFFREFNLWGQLDHTNIARMLGYSVSDGNISLISFWHTHGNLVQYLQAKSEASKRDLILDVAEGVQYLHSHPSPLVHGDLKGANVLVNQNGIACIADFGLSRQIDEMNRQTGFTTSSGATGTPPFTAPELSEGENLQLPCDIYSCAGVFLQIYCPGRVPFDYIQNRFQMAQAKRRGETPERSRYPGVAGEDALWLLMGECWKLDPLQRPTIGTIVQKLYEMFQLNTRADQSNPRRSTNHFQYLWDPLASAIERIPRDHASQQITGLATEEKTAPLPDVYQQHWNQIEDTTTGLPPRSVQARGVYDSMNWAGDTMLHIYILDYCRKRGFANVVVALCQATSTSPDIPVPIDAPQGLLYEWWTVLLGGFRQQIYPNISHPMLQFGSLGDPHTDHQSASRSILWQGGSALHIYILDYCRKRRFTNVVEALSQDTGTPHDVHVPTDAPQGLLYEWWVVFWDVLTARNNSDTASMDAISYSRGQRLRLNQARDL